MGFNIDCHQKGTKVGQLNIKLTVSFMRAKGTFILAK